MDACPYIICSQKSLPVFLAFHLQHLMQDVSIMFAVTACDMGQARSFYYDAVSMLVNSSPILISLATISVLLEPKLKKN